jgi:hypothetical protein
LRLAILIADPRSTDAANFRIALDVLRIHGLESYSIFDRTIPHTFPYPPLFLGWIGVVDGADGLMRLPGIAADLTLAWLVQHVMGARGFSPPARLGATALIALGPPVWDTSTNQSQIDTLAILPAFVGALVWERGHGHRALVAGLLVGIGAAIKLPAGLVLLGLLPTRVSLREGLVLSGVAAAVPAVLLAPFAIADPGGVASAITYHGYPRFGGYAVLLSPEATRIASDASGPLTLAALLGAFAWVLYRRTPPMAATALIFIAVYLFGVHWNVQYLMWSIPFLLVAGEVMGVLVMELLTLGLMLRLAATNARPLARVYADAGDAIEAVSMASLYGTWLVVGARLAGKPPTQP